MPTALLALAMVATLAALALPAHADAIEVTQDAAAIHLRTPHLEATIRKEGYVSGVGAGSFLDRKTGFRDPGFGLDIVDWLMEPGSDEAYRAQLPKDLVYKFGDLVHGDLAKRSIEGPQICTQARKLDPQIIQAATFVAITSRYQYSLAAPGKQAGSTWTQTLVFPHDTRYFFACDQITTVNASPALFLRLDMPGHIRHHGADTFSEVYLSYHGRIAAREFLDDFAPDARFLYRRDDSKIPRRFIRAYRLRDPKTGQDGPWLAGMTLQPDVVSEAWCHQRGYVCMIEEFGGRPIAAGQSFRAAFLVGYFDSIAEMEQVYDRYAGHTDLRVTPSAWQLAP